MATVIDERNPPPSIEERLLVASNTSSLLVDSLHHGADILVAAGLAAKNGNQLGLALVHLRAEWDRTDKPSKKTPEEIAEHAKAMKDKKGRPDKRRAHAEAIAWHARAMRDRALKLSGRSAVMGLLTDWAMLRQVDLDLLSPALFHWLAPACPVCGGHGKMKFQDAPTLTDKTCIHCHGTGTWPRPLGAERVHDHIKSCVGKVPKAIREKLYG